MMSNYKYRAAGHSDKGNVKEVNQDAYSVKKATFNGEECLFALVADGMGGIDDGERASRTIKEYMDEWFCEELEPMLMSEEFERDAEEFAEDLFSRWQDAITEANDKLNEEAAVNCGTTLTMIFLYKGAYFSANIGDSRTYIMNDDGIMLITEDHSWAWEAEHRGLSPEEIENDVKSSALTRCIGAHNTDYPEVDYRVYMYEKGTAFLLCSDGLRHRIKTVEMEGELRNENNNTKEVAEKLVDMAMERGESDNVTAVVIRVTDGVPIADINIGEAARLPAGKTEVLE